MSESMFDTFRRTASAVNRGETRRDRVRFAVLYASLGAVAGVAVGMAIAERGGGLQGLRRKFGRGGLGGDNSKDYRDSTGWSADDPPTDVFDGFDDDSELAPESIAHMHVRSAGSGAGSRMSERVRELRDRMLPARGTESEMSAAGSPRRGGFDQEVPASATAERAVRTTPLRSLPDEAALEARVLEAFINDPILRERAIDICASGVGTIELTGWVRESGEIGHALTLAGGVPDVKTVIDRLAVRGGAPARDHSGSRYAGPPPAAASRGARPIRNSSSAGAQEMPPLPPDAGSMRAD